MRGQKKKQSGITLIALVITIIVLLILAGVSINLVLGENGVLEQAQGAVEANEEARIAELRQFTIAEAAMNFEKYKYTDSDGTEAWIPAYCAVSQVEGEQNVDTGLVIIDKLGNEYVYIPVADVVNYARTTGWIIENDNSTIATKDETTLGSITLSQSDIDNGITQEILTEIVAQISAEKASVEEYKGYYIGRYETGNVEGQAVIKSNVTPYTDIKWSKAYELAKTIGNGATLCSSYAWDTAINYLQNSGITDYATSRDNFNENWKDREVVDKNGLVIKVNGTETRLNTGLTTAKLNIFDMGGNVAEFTTEINPGVDDSAVLRGGAFYHVSSPAGSRWDTNASFSFIGFRATLFIK